VTTLYSNTAYGMISGSPIARYRAIIAEELSPPPGRQHLQPEDRTMRTSSCLTLSSLALALLTAACGSSNTLAPQYQPQVVNTPNVAFSFQATGLQGVSDALGYTWSVSSGSVIIHPATTTTAGNITLNIKDATGAVIYNGPVPPSGDITPPAGAAGAWKIGVTLVNYTGTVNFALQMK
jgi:hypothetical protein